MAKVGLAREMTVHPMRGDLDGATPIVPIDGVLLRVRATQMPGEFPDMSLGRGESALFLPYAQAEALIPLLEQALRQLRAPNS